MLDVLKTMHRNARQLLQLINEFLEFSRLNNGQMKVSLSSGELIPFVQESIAAFDEMAREKNISIHFAAKEVEGHYLFDEDKWEKIIQNLLGNAIPFHTSQWKSGIAADGPWRSRAAEGER